jgi:hypothetical protein
VRAAHAQIDAQPQDQAASKEAAMEALWDDLDTVEALRALIEFEPWAKTMLLRAVINEAVRQRHDATKVIYGPAESSLRFGRPKGGGAQVSNADQESIGAAARKNGGAGKGQDMDEGQPALVHPASPSRTQIEANKEVAKSAARNWLRAYMINGQRLGNVTKRELMDSAKSDAVNSRFKALLASRLPTDETKVGDCMTDVDVDKIFAAAKEPSNE